MMTILAIVTLWVGLPFLFFARVYYVRRPPPVPMVPMPSGSITDRVIH
jgi:hypothetical protein